MVTVIGEGDASAEDDQFSVGDFEHPVPHAALFAEWRADYAAARLRDGLGEPPMSDKLEAIDKQIQSIKEEPDHVALVASAGSMVEIVHIGAWNDWKEVQRLHALEGMVDWQGVEPADKHRVMEREVDFSQVAPTDQQHILGEVWQQNDAKPVASAHTPEERPIRPLTQQLIDAVTLDVWPGVAAIVDFGIDSENHLGALQYAIRSELVTPQELDAAMGKGDKLTEIARLGDNPYGDVVFKTSWDAMTLEPEASPEKERHVHAGTSAAGPPHSWPSEIAKSERQASAAPDPSNGKERGDGHDDGHSM